MSTVLDATNPVGTDPTLTEAVINSLKGALTMCDAEAECVSISRVPSRDTGIITGMIGVHGKVSGFVTINMSEKMGIKLVGGLLQDTYTELTSQVVDAAGEITNLIVGGIKSSLAGSEWSFLDMTVPSVIVGQGFAINYAKGLQFICAAFECKDDEVIMLQDRLIQVSVSLLKL
jgi:chemotaxis protein CheX